MAVLSALVRGAEDPVGSAKRSKQVFRAASVTDLDARIRFLAARLGLPEIHPARLGEVWSGVLTRKPSPSRRELLDLARRAVVTWNEPDPEIGAWRRALFARLEPTLSSMGALDAFGPETPPEIRHSHIELNPLLADWPRRLLNDSEWAFVEAPLPNIDPLPLDEVWVDLRLVAPEETAAPVTGVALREALDLRYEERHWLADPLQFTLEGLDGSVILVGSPGSGKTTLLKWIARRLIANPDGRFLLPLFIPLRAYGTWKREHPEDSLLDFGLLQAGISDARQRDLWTNALSYLSGPRGENVLLLLDGWDEVRELDRPPLHREIEELGHGFSMLLTSRPSGWPQSLPIHDLYEITELSPASIEKLIDRWFHFMGEPGLAAPLRRQLNRSVDLRRLARNPFLLTLLCGLAWRDGGGALPTSRAVLYEAAMKLTYDQDAKRHKQDVRRRWSDARRCQIERLALWLLDEAPESPRYVFGPEDVQASGAEPGLLDEYLKPSRLLAQWGLTPDTHHFLHATFQEYLAARSLATLARNKPGELLSHLRRHFFSGSWHEVFHFLSGLPGEGREVFWQGMAKLGRERDRFGQLAIRIARFAAESGIEDGGYARLGFDLRDELWAGIVRFTANALYVDAYAALDPAGLALRAQQSLQNAGRRTEALILQALGRTAAPETSKALVDRILQGDFRTAAVALNQLDILRRLDAGSLARLRSAAASRRVTPEVRSRAVWALGSIRDHASIRRIVGALFDPPLVAGVAQAVFFALSSLGSDEAVDTVRQLIDASEDPEWGSMIASCLERIRSPASRDLLLEMIALRPPDDPTVIETLKALGGMPIHQGTNVLLGLIAPGGSAELRAAAASALEAANGAGVVDALAKAAREDTDADVRKSALHSLERRARPFDARWLQEAVRDPRRGDRERALALTALGVAAQRFRGSADAVWLLPLAAGEILRLLENPEGVEVTRKAAHLAFLAGEIAVPRLLTLCQSDEIDPEVRYRACESLGRLKARPAVESLLELLRRAPNVEEDEEALPEAAANLAREAAGALAAIDPAVLLREPGATAAKALARWALETGSLVFEDRVLGPDGRVTARAPQPEASSSQAPQSLNRLDLHPDLQLVVRPIGDDDSQLMFELAVRDPRLGPGQDDFGPVALPQSARAFRKDLLLDLEDLTCKDHEMREISRARLAVKGTTLFRLLPPGLQRWLWMLKDSERTLELFSEEPFLPWELILLQPQGGDGGQGLFLHQAFTITRWLRGLRAQLDFPLSRIALVAPRWDDLPSALKERADILSLHVPGVREVTEIEPRYLAVRSALSSGEFDAWHFVGHASSRAEDPDRWEFRLEGDTSLRPEDLKSAGDFGRLRPWVFFNGCRTGGGGVSLDGTSGWAKRFLEAGAGSFIGTHWSVSDRAAREVAIALYSHFLGGMPIGKALRKIREDLLEEDPLTALNYMVYAHPLAACR